MIMLYELLFRPLVTKEDVLKPSFIRSKHFDLSHSPYEEGSSFVKKIIKNPKKPPRWYKRMIPEDGNNVHVSCQYSKKGVKWKTISQVA